MKYRGAILFYLLVAIIGLLLSIQATAQKLTWPQVNKLLEQKRYAEAFPHLESFYLQDSNNIDVVTKLGNVSDLMKLSSKSYRYNLQLFSLMAIEQYSGAKKLVAERLIRYQIQIGNYEAAREVCKKIMADSATDEGLKQQNFKLNKSIEFALAQIKSFNASKSKTVISKIPAPLNQYQQQYLPAMDYAESYMVFTARGHKASRKDEDLLVSNFENGQWQTPEPIKGEVNTEWNDGSGTISADGKTLVFTACEGPSAKNGCDLFIAYKNEDGLWGKPQALTILNSRWWDSHPCISADGQKIYFVSQRPGGMGKGDIWFSKKDEQGIWQEPENLGPEVNTSEDENAPFIHPNGRLLFFSTNGLIGMGGYDLYVYDLTKPKSKPINLGFPINTFSDETSCWVNSDLNRAILTREFIQEGKSETKAELFETPLNLPKELVGNSKTRVVTGKIVEIEKSTPIAAEIRAYTNDGLVSKVTSDEETGFFSMPFDAGKKTVLKIFKKGFLFESFPLDSLKNTLLETGVRKLKPVQMKGEAAILGNIYFETNSFKLLKTSFVELDFVAEFMFKNPTIKIQIEGHTDDVGNQQANLLLSQRRANAVVEYLKQKGVSQTRISAKGLGATMPVVPNNSTENRALNRRITLKIV